MNDSSPKKIISIVAGLALLVIFIVGIQKACDKRAERIEDEKLRAYDAEVASKLAVFQSYIDLANKDHETTTQILDAMVGMSKNISLLAENDKTITARVEEISRDEYKAARYQKNDQAAVKTGKAKSTKSIDARETEALKTDALLYPEN